jgi:hypothetical protein
MHSRILAVVLLALLSIGCARGPGQAPAGDRVPSKFFYEGPKSPAGFFCRDLTPLQRGWIEPRWGCYDLPGQKG